MSPIALADARPKIRVRSFWLTLFALTALSFAAVAQVREIGDDAPSAVFNQRPRVPVFHPLTITGPVSVGVAGQTYSSMLHVLGGTPPYIFWIEQGTLPAGLSIGNTGVISGVPATGGTFGFTVAVRDSSFGFGRQSLQMTVGSPEQVKISVTPGSAQVAPGGRLQLSAAVSNTSQTAVVWSVSGGSISSSGLFTAPARIGTYAVTATAVANSNVRASANISVEPLAALTIETRSLNTARVKSSYNAALTAQGGRAPYRWALTAGSLPSGLGIDATTGTIAGTALQSGNFAFTAKVTDAAAHESTRQLNLNVASITSGNYDGPAELPRVYVQSAMANTPAPGATITVTAGSNLQSVLSNVSCGDTIQLQAGATFTGFFTLPNKNCDDNHWIVIRTSAPDSVLPPEGTRITPCYAGVASLPGRPALNCASTQKVMATLMAARSGPIEFANGASHYRLGPGLEITRPAGTGINFGLIDKEVTSSANHIILDRDWVHGTAQDETTRGLHLSGFTYAGVIDSYFTDFHCTAVIGECMDAQAIAGGSGYVPMSTWKIVNNFLEASTENMLLGGAAGNTTPTDIEIRHNHFFKPLTWKAGEPDFVGTVNRDPRKCTQFRTPGFCPFAVKNLLEFKNAQRVLVEGNVFEHTWPGFTQHGAAVLFLAMSQGGTTGNPDATVADITFRYNRISHAASALVMGIVGVGHHSWSIPKFAGRFSVHDDIFDDLSPAYYNGDSTAVGLAFQMSQCAVCTPLQNISINHVTVLLQDPKMFLILGAPLKTPVANVSVTNTIASTPAGLAVTGTGLKAPCGFYGDTNLARINSCTNTPDSVRGNALIGASSIWPKGNMLPESPLDVGFANYNNGNGGDYHLITGPYLNAATDGTPLGANVDAVDAETTGVL